MNNKLGSFILKRIFLISSIAFSTGVYATCEFSAAAAARDFAGGVESGESGYVAGCYLANSLGIELCGEYFRDENGQFCTNNGAPDSSADIAEAYGELVWSYHPGYVIGNMSTVNYNAPMPPPGWLMTRDEWERMRDPNAGGGFNDTF